MGKLKPLPKKREKGQPKIDGFLVKKKKRVTNNASKTPKAPRAPIPKNKKIIDVDDDDVIFIDHKEGCQIDLTGESPEKEKPKKTPELVDGFDLSNSEGNKVVEPEAMEVEPKEVFDIFKKKKKDVSGHVPAGATAVLEMRRVGDVTWRRFKTQSEAGKAFGIAQSEVSHLLNNRSKAAGKSLVYEARRVVAAPRRRNAPAPAAPVACGRSPPQRRSLYGEPTQTAPEDRRFEPLDPAELPAQSIPRLLSLFPEGTNGRAVFGLNYKLDLAPLIDAKDSEVGPAIELFKDKQSERLGVKKSDLIIKVGATSKAPELMCRHLDNWTYPEEIFLREPFALCIGISSDSKVRTIEDHGWHRTDSTNKIRSGGLDRPSMNIRISRKTPGLVYVMTAKKKFTTVRSVHDALRKLHCERINKEDVRLAQAESEGLQYEPSVGYWRSLLQVLLVSVDDQDMEEVHNCFTKKGRFRLNDFCSKMPEVMGQLTSPYFVGGSGYPKLVEAYCEVFPDRRDTVMTMHGNTQHDVAIPLAEKLRGNTPFFITRAEVDVLVAGGTKYPIELQQNNPKKLGTEAGQLYFAYQSAKTVAEMLEKGARKWDIQDCFVKGYLKLVEAEPRASDIPDCFKKGYVKKPP